MSPVAHAATLARFELVLLLRNKTNAAMALVLPLALGAFFAFGRIAEGGWHLALTLQILAATGMSVYVMTTIAFASRRQDLSLKRLRAGEVSDGAIIAGTALPPVLIGLAQGAIMVGLAFAAGAPAPPHAQALVAAVVGQVAVCSALGLLTAQFTSSAEAAQITTSPYFLATFAGAIWTLSTPADQVRPWHALAPGGAPAELVRAAFEGSTLPLYWPLVAMVLWTAVAWAFGTRHFRWDRR